MKQLQDKLAKIRAEIEKLVAERDEIASATIPRDEAVTMIAAVVNAPYSGTITGSDARFDTNPAPAGLQNGTFNYDELLQTLQRPGVLRAVFPKALEEYLIGLYDAQIEDEPGLGAVQRRKKLAEIDAEIFALEVAEEAICETLEAGGGDVARRVDADPIAQLGLAERDTAA